MSYLGGFMGGNSPDYNQNPGILGLYNFIQSGYTAGKAQGQNQALSQLAQKTYTDTGDAQKQDISQAIGIDPQMGYALAGKAQAQQATQQAQQNQVLARYGKAASDILAAKQRGDDATAEGIYQSIVPELDALSARSGGPTPPPTLQGTDMSALYRLASLYGQMPQPAKGVVVSAGGAVVNPTTGTQMYRNPYGMKYENVPMGAGQAAGAFDPNTGTVRPAAGGAPQVPAQAAPMGGQTAASPSPGLNTSVPGANGQSVAFNFPPGTPPEVIAAAQASAVANGDIAPGAMPQTAVPQAVAAPAQFGVGTKGASTDLIAQRAQQIAELKAHGVQFTPQDEQAYLTTGKGQSVANSNSVTAPIPGDPTKTGAAYIASLPTGLQGPAQMLAEGKAPWPTGTVLRSEYGQQLSAAAKQINPNVDATSYPSRLAVSKSVGAGPLGNSTNAFNTALQHANALIDANQAMDVSNLPVVGSIDAGMLNLQRNNAYNAFIAGRMPFASEMARAYKGGAPAEGEIDQYYQMLDPSAGQKAIAQRLQTYTDFLYSKALANARQYQQGMRDAGIPYAPLPPETLGAIQSSREIALKAGVPQTKLDQEAEKIGVNAIARTPAGQQTPQSAAQPSQQAPGTGVDSLLSKYGIQ